MYVEIKDEANSEMRSKIKRNIDERYIFLEAMNLLKQLDIIAQALDSFQVCLVHIIDY